MSDFYNNTVKRMNVAQLSTSQEGVDLIKFYEGLGLEAYKDSVGVTTIGYGHTSTAKRGEIITEQEAENLLKKDLETFEEGLTRLVKVPLTQYEYDALISFSFNLGLGNLGSSTLLKKVNSQDYVNAADEFVKWIYAGGKVLNGLVKRRKAEREMFLGN